jgi:hypothetical protein
LSEEFSKKHGYKILTEKEIEDVEIYGMPDQIIDDLAKEKGSLLNAQIYLTQNRYKPLENFIETIIVELQKREKIHAIMNWQIHYKSIYYLAEKYNIRIIVNEIGPMRFPFYRDTGCLCFNDIHCSREVEDRYAQFKKEFNETIHPQLSRKNILEMFLKKKYQYMVNFLSSPKTIEMGIIGTSPINVSCFSKCMYDDFQMIQDVRKVYNDDQIVFRQHPGVGDPYQANYYYIKRYDRSNSAIEFISKCKRVCSVHSSALFEAMLLGIPAFSGCTLSQYSSHCERYYDNTEVLPAEQLFINFVVFGYLIPYELMLNKEYLDWRLTNPSEMDIYMRNLQYYCDKFLISKEMLMQLPEYREKIISKRIKNYYMEEENNE